MWGQWLARRLGDSEQKEFREHRNELHCSAAVDDSDNNASHNIRNASRTECRLFEAVLTLSHALTQWSSKSCL